MRLGGIRCLVCLVELRLVSSKPKLGKLHTTWQVDFEILIFACIKICSDKGQVVDSHRIGCGSTAIRIFVLNSNQTCICRISDLDLGYVVELLLDSTHSISNWGSPAHLLAFGLAWCSQGPKVKTKQFRAPRPWGHGAMPTFAWRYLEHVELYLQFTSSYCGWGNTPRHCILFVFIVFMVFAIVIIVVIISIRSFSTSLSLHLPFLYIDYIFPSNEEFDAFSAWLMRTSSRQRTCIHVAAHFQCRDVSSFIFESFEPFCQFTNGCFESFVSHSLTSVVSCLSCRWVARLAQWSKLRWRLQVCNQAWA